MSSIGLLFVSVGFFALGSDGIDSQIEQLVSKNPRPQWVKIKGERFLEFSKDYDVGEQERVYRAFIKTAKAFRAADWFDLTEHIGDERYAVTLREEGELADVYTVGDLCRAVAHHQVQQIIDKNLELNIRGRPLSLPVIIDVPVKNTPPLLDLQLKYCRLAIDQLMLDEGMSAASRQRMIGNFRRQIETLERDKEPLVFTFPTDSLQLVVPGR